MKRVMKQSWCDMSFAAIAGILAVLAGCAGAEPTPEQQAREVVKHETINDILSQPLAAEEYADERRCLSTRSYDSVDVLDDEHVVFRGTGDKIWVNKLRHRCVGLRRDRILRFEMRDSRICDLDRFEAVSAHAFGISSGVCSLGTFTPVTPEQVEAIEVAVKEARDG